MPIENYDFQITLAPDDTQPLLDKISVFKRPGVDNFLKVMSQYYELIIFTAGMGKYAKPIIDKLDPENYIEHRLYRDSCHLI